MINFTQFSHHVSYVHILNVVPSALKRMLLHLLYNFGIVLIWRKGRTWRKFWLKGSKENRIEIAKKKNQTIPNFSGLPQQKSASRWCYMLIKSQLQLCDAWFLPRSQANAVPSVRSIDNCLRKAQENMAFRTSFFFNVPYIIGQSSHTAQLDISGVEKHNSS